MGLFLSKRKNVTQLKEHHNRIERNLYQHSSEDLESLYELFESNLSGLSKPEAADRLEELGANVITLGSKNTLLYRLRDSVINSFNIILFVIAIITYLTDVVFAEVSSYLTLTIILLLILLSGVVAFIQGEKSNSAAEKLSKMISNRAHVIRDGIESEIPIEEVVPGDIVKLAAGDMLPADVRFISTKDTFIAQAALTGESNPVEKHASNGFEKNESSSLTDISNLGFMGSNVVSGSALAIALYTGNDTYMGSMAKSITGQKAQNSFERGVDSVSRLLIQLMIIMVPLVFLINGFTKNNWSSAFLFAISVAVGLTPEMLPVIMTSTLAKGAVSMSKRRVIVKSLGAIQTFGEMNILCTDKTGTLTEDKIVLEKYMDLAGKDDPRILRHAYLNSYFQTGLKNLIDVAIINRANEKKLDSILSNYTRIDEIPFDFSRRRMSVVLEDTTEKRQLITKGAVEEIMSICTLAEIEGQVVPLSDKFRKQAMDIYHKHNNDGLRMIAVAQKNEVPGIDVFSVEDEKDMVLIGFVGFLDPPKDSARSAIAALKDHGVRTVVLTGDSAGVAVKVCGKVGIDTTIYYEGNDVEAMSDSELNEAVKSCDLFAKLSPEQKKRVVNAFQANGNTVGYLGDGINDAPPLHVADIGISVDNAVDIAKETANIILLEKDLMVLEEGVIEGRKTFGNIIKYIKMASSGNFGNMFSVLIASIFLPFLPMLPVQILVQNLLCDFSQLGIPFDRVDEEYVKKPRRWETKSIKLFMAIMGPLSSIFDILCFAVLWWIMGANTLDKAALFQGGWFIFGTISQILIIHMIRTSKLPFVQSKAAAPLVFSTLIITLVSLIIVFSPLALVLDMSILPFGFLPWLILLLLGYALSTQALKALYISKFKEWL